MSKQKGVTYFCVNENPDSINPFSVEVSLNKNLNLYFLFIGIVKIYKNC